MQSLRRAALALALTWMLPCAVARADVSVSITPFDPAEGPIGITACGTELALSFTGQHLHEDGSPFLIDVWWSADPTIECGNATLRASGACTHLDVPTGAMVSGSHGVTLTMTPAALFADVADPCTGASLERTFFFLDADVSGDLVTTFDVSHRAVRTLVLDTIAPSAPTVDGDAIGDTELTIGWIPATNDPSEPVARFYVDTAGCPRTGVPSSLTLLPGHAPPIAELVYTDSAPSTEDTSTFPTTSLNWPSTVYGQTGVLAMTVVDAAGNESPLSNLVCVYHTPCAGDRDGGTSCSSGAGCSIAHGRPSASVLPVALLGLLGYEIARRWKRSSSSRSSSVPPSRSGSRAGPRERSATPDR